MAFESLVERARRRKAHGGSSSDTTITFSQRNVNKHGYFTIAFSIGPRLVTDAGFIKGDKLDILWDPTDEIGMIRRDNEKGKGFTMAPTGRGLLQITWSEGMPRPQDGKRVFLSGAEVKHGEIIFDLPTHKESE